MITQWETAPYSRASNAQFMDTNGTRYLVKRKEPRSKYFRVLVNGKPAEGVAAGDWISMDAAKRAAEAHAANVFTTYTVRTRYGWGWEVVAPGFQSYPFQSSIAAENYAAARAKGNDHATAVRAANVEFRDGRFYDKGN